MLAKAMKYLAALVLIVAVCSLAIAANEPVGLGPAPTTDDYLRVRDGYIAARENRCEDVMVLLRPAVDDPAFPGFPVRVRHGALTHIVECAQTLRDWRAGLAYLYQLIEYRDEKTPHWIRRIIWAGVALKEPEIGVDGLLRLLEFGPREVRRVKHEWLLNINQGIKLQDRGDDLRYQFLRALYDVRYSPRHPFHTADEFMLEYARLAADRGDTDGLREIILSLTQPGQILQVRIDRRFDPIRQDGSLESFLNLESAAENENARLRSLPEKYDNYASGYIMYARALVAVWRFEEALDVIEPIALRIRTPEGREEFVDSKREESWVLKTYSDVLWHARYPEQSEDIFRESVRPLDSDKSSISQQINFASGNASKGKFSEALDGVANLDDDRASEYGRMWVRKIRVCAKAMAESPSDYTNSLNYLIANQRANPAALLKAYLCMNDMDKAAEVLIRRLYSSDQRIEALLSLQHRSYSINGTNALSGVPHSHDPHDSVSPGHLLRHRFDELRDRGDVLEAVESVGRIEEVWLHHSAWRRH